MEKKGTMTLHKRDELYSRPDLKARGWTDGLIAKFLPIADDLRDNPHYKKSPPMSLYLRTRVEQVERDEAFKAAMERTERRKDGAQMAVATRAATIKARCEQVQIKVEVVSYREVKRLSMATHGGNYEGDPGEWRWNYRAAMSCVRHCLTNYEALWALCNRGFTGQGGYEVLRDRVDDAIMERYPWLASEDAFEKEEMGSR